MRPGRVWVLGLLLGALGGCRWADADQPVHTGKAFVLETGHTIGQTFVARRAGLAGFAFWLDPEPEAQGTLEFQLVPAPDSGAPAGSVFRSARLRLPEGSPAGFYRFLFEPIPGSHGQDYLALLRFQGSGRLRIGTGPPEAYLDGALYVDGDPKEAQATFQLIYDPLWILSDVARGALKGLFLLGLSACLYVGPGLWLLDLGGIPRHAQGGGLGRAALAAGVGLALYPVLFLWSDLLGLRWGRWGVGGIGAVGLLRLLWEGWRKWRTGHGFQPSGADLALIGTLGLGWAVRLWAVRDLEAPMWGDGFQHTVITQLFLDHGGLFRSWAPYAPIESFTYHFGFHSTMAVLAWATGWSVEKVVLFGGQVLNGWAAWTLYPLAVRLAGGSPWAGVVAVLLPALLWPMPMFYVNWGRYPQLAGQVILPVVVWLIWEWLEAPRISRRAGLVTALAVAGLAFTHYRVLAFFAAFVIGWGLVRGWALPPSARVQAILRAAAVALVVAALLAPWLLRLGEGGLPAFLQRQMAGGDTGGGSLPGWGDLRRYLPEWGWVLLGLAVAVGGMRRPREVALVAAWWGVAFLTAHPSALRLPGAMVISGFAFWIALYIPAALMVGMAAGLGGRERQGWGYLLAILVGIAGIWGGMDRRRDVQPGIHALVTRPDRRAMAWIREHTPPEARFLINGFLAYEGQDAVGSDGGWWLPLLARRAAFIPPLPYAIERPRDPNLPLRLREAIRRLAAQDPQALADLAREGWCYLYIGQRRGHVNTSHALFEDFKSWQQGGFLKEIYRNDLVIVFNIVLCGHG